MPKYLSNRVKRTPQSGLTSDRYQYLGLEQAEPNLGDPANPLPNVPTGSQFQVVSVRENPGERYWVPIGGGIKPGSITVREEGNVVPPGGVSSITTLDFRGDIITAVGSQVNGAPGTAVTLTVAPVGSDHQLIFNNNGEFGAASGLVYDNSVGLGSVGIGTATPKKLLHVGGNVQIDGTIYDNDEDGGSADQVLSKDTNNKLVWLNKSGITPGAGGTIKNVQYHNAAGNIDGAGNFVFDYTTNRVGIGTTIPSNILHVVGDPLIDGDTTFKGNVSIAGTLTYEDVKNVDSVGLITARTGIKVLSGGIDVQGGTTTLQNTKLNDNVKLRFGNDEDLELYHNGSWNYIDNIGTKNFVIRVNGTDNALVAIPDGKTSLYHDGNEKLQTTDTGISVIGLTTTTDLNVTGFVTSHMVPGGATGTYDLGTAGARWGTVYANTFDGSSLIDTSNIITQYLKVTGVSTFVGLSTFANGLIVHTGVSTFIGNIDADGNLDVDGQTDLDVLNVSETATFSALVDINNNLDVDGRTDLDDLLVTGVSTFSSLVKMTNGGEANTFKVSDLTSGRVVLAGTNGELEDNANLTFNGQILNITGHTETDTFRASGISTFASQVNFDNSSNAGRDIQWQPTSDRLAFFDNVKATFGNQVDLQLSHNGSDSVISHIGSATGNLKILSGGAQSIECVKAGAVKISHNGNQKIETTDTGISVTGLTTTTDLSLSGKVDSHLIPKGVTGTYDIGTAGARWGTVYANTFDGTSLIDSTNIITEYLKVTGISTFVGDTYHLSKVGIGTTNPGSPLEVNGGSALDTATFNSHHANGVLINLQRSGTSKGFLGSGKNIADATGGVDDIGLRSNANLIFTSGGGTERLRILSDGKVAIGTYTAGAAQCDTLTLETTGHTGMTFFSGTSSRGTIAFGDGRTGNEQYRGVIMYDHSDDSMRLVTADAERLRITSGGNVGIGITNPQKLLDLYAANPTIGVKATGGNDASLELIETGGPAIDFGETGSAGFRIRYDGGDNRLYFVSGVDTTTNTRVSIERDTGKVGIGTDDPSHLLNLYGAAPVLAIQANTTTGISSIHFSDVDGDKGKIRYDHTGNYLAFDVENGEKVRIASDGKVGIATVTPRAIFDVRPGGHSGDGAITFTTGLGEVGSSNNAIQSINGTGSALQPLGYRATEHIFATQSAEALRITSDGQVLITSNTDPQLEIRSSDSGQTSLIFNNSTTGSGAANGLFLGIGADEVGYMWHYESGSSLIFGTSNETHLTIDSSGHTFPKNTAENQDLGLANKRWRTLYAQDIDITGTIDISGDANIDNLHVSGVATFLGNVSIGGTLTYEDVKNVDSVGLITARSGIHVLANGMDVVGVSTFSSDVEIGETLTITGNNPNITFVDTDNNPDYKIYASNGAFTIQDGTSSKFIIGSTGTKTIQNGNLNINSTYIDFSGDISTPATAAAIFRPADNTLAFSTANEERLRIDSNGNVGIGTDTMDSSGNLNITDTGSARIYMKSGNSSDCSIYFGAFDDAATGGIRYDHSDDSLRFMGYNNAERLRIDSVGRHGINVTNTGDYYSAADDLIIRETNGGDSGITIRTGTANSGLICFADGASATSDQYRRGQIRYHHNNDSMDFTTAGNTVRMTITSTGALEGQTEYAAVGINTFAKFTRTGGGGPHLEIGYNAVTTDYGYFGTGTAHGLGLRTNDTTALFIDTDQKVGIGTDAPNYHLHVNGTSYTSYAGSYTGAPYTIGIHGLNAYNSGTAGAGIIFSGKTDSSGSVSALGVIAAIKENSTDGNNAGALVFMPRTNSQGSGANEKMRISSDGKVGIGKNSNLLYQLEVQRNSSSLLRINNSGESGHGSHDALIVAGGTYYQNPVIGGSTIKFNTFNGSTFDERVRITSAGNVGIGITNNINLAADGSNTSILNCGIVTANEYYGTFKGTIDSSGLVASQMTIAEDNADNKAYLNFTGSYTGNQALKANQKLVFDAGNTRLGIGTDGPEVSLHVENPSGSGKLKVEGRANGDATIVLQGHGSGKPKLALWDTLDIGKAHLTNNDIDGDSWVHIANDGKVGIGTNIPRGAILHLESNGPILRFTDANGPTNNRNWHIATNTDRTLRFQAIDDSNDNSGNGAGGGHHFDFYRADENINEFRGVGAGVTWFVVNNDLKKVSIGETAPAADLVVKQSGSTFTTASQTVALFQRSSTTGHSAKISIVGGNAATSDVNFGDVDDEDIGKIQYYHTDNSFRFTTNNTEKLRVDASGRVVISNNSGSHAGGSQFVVMGGNINNYASAAFGNKDTTPTSGTTFAMFRFNSGSGGTSRGAEIIAAADETWVTTGANSVKKYPTRLIFSTTGNQAGNISATERLRITSDGNLYLGGTSSVNDLTENNAGQRGLVIGSTGMGNAGLAIINSTTGTGRIYFGDATGSSADRHRGFINYYHNDGSNSDYMIFGTAGSERLRITSDGQTIVKGTDDQDNFVVDVGNTQFAIHTDDTDGELSLRAQSEGATTDPKYMTFYTQKNGEVSKERLRITPAGDVGIGTNNPIGANALTNNNTTLAVGIVTANTGYFKGNLTVDGTLSYEDVSNVDAVGLSTFNADIDLQDWIRHKGNITTKFGFPADNTIAFHTDGSERMRITSAGHLEPSANTTYHCGSPTKRWNSIYGQTLSLTSYAAVGSIVAADPGSDYYAYNNRIGSDLAIVGTTRMFGSVGIGTNNPENGLHVSDGSTYAAPQNTGAGKIMIEHASSADLQFMTANSGYNHIFFGDQDDANIGSIVYHHASNANAMVFNTNTAERLRIDSGGRVLLGTQRTYGDLSYYDDITINNSNGATNELGGTGITLISKNTSWNALLFGDSDDNDVGAIKYDHSNNHMRFVVNGIDPVLYINSSGYVGINTTAMSNSERLAVELANDEMFELRSSAQELFQVWKEGNTQEARLNIKYNGSNKIHLRGNGDSYFNGGYVGINTNNPGRQLHIVGNDGATGATLGNSDTQLVIDNKGGNGAIVEFLSDTNGAGRLMFTDTGGSNRGRVEYSHTSDYLRFDTAGSQRLTIDSSGHVYPNVDETQNLGTSNKRWNILYAKDIDINGTIDVTGDVNIGDLYVTGVSTFVGQSHHLSSVGINTTVMGRAGADELTVASTGDSGITIRSGSSNEGNIYFADSDQNGTGQMRSVIRHDHSDDSMQFWIANGNNWPTEKLRITSIGRVGINSTVPTAPLNVQAETSTGTCLRLNQEPTYGKASIYFQDSAVPTSSDSWIINENFDLSVYAGYSGKLNLGANTKTGITVIGSGNVGMGTDNPGKTLDLWGNLQVKDVNGKVGLLVDPALGDFHVNQSVASWTNTDQDPVRILGWDWKSGPGNHMFMASGGNDATATQMALVISEGHGFKVGRSAWNGTNSDVSSTAEYFRITNAGKVGIGTDNPTVNLHSYHATTNTVAKFESGDSSVNIRFKDGDTTNEMGIGALGNDFIVTATSGGERLRVTSAGNVGIGTNNPTAPLQINHASPKIILEDNDNAADVSIANVGGAAVYSSASDILFQTVDTSEKVRITSAGDVGIGTNNPTGANAVTNNTKTLAVGNIVANDGTFKGNVNVEGTLTYEDVTNIDAVGLSTFKDGIHVIGGRESIGIGTTNPVSNPATGTVAVPLGIVKNPGSSGWHEMVSISAGNDSNNTGSTLRLGQYGNDRGLYIQAGRGTSDRALAKFGMRASNADNLPCMTFLQNGTTVGPRIGFHKDTPKAIVDIKGSGSGDLIPLMVRNGTYSSEMEHFRIGRTDTGNAVASDDDIRYHSWWSKNHSTDYENYVGIRVHKGTVGADNTQQREVIRFRGDGNVGINSTAPAAPLDVHKVNGTIAQFGDINVNTYEGLFIKNDVSSYPAIENGDSNMTIAMRAAGSIQMEIDANNNDTAKYFRVTTNGTGASGTEIFRVQEDGQLQATSVADVRLTLGSSGTAGTNDSVHVRADSADLKFMAADGGNTVFEENGTERLRITSTGEVNIGGNYSQTTYKMRVTGTVAATHFDSLSDLKLKSNVKQIENPIETVKKIDGVTFNWKEDNEASMGVIAQNVEKVIPELISKDEDDVRSVNYSGLIGLLIETVKEQQKQIDELKSRLDK